MADRLSTREERLAEGRHLLKLILGTPPVWTTGMNRKPAFFPSGLNYTPKEWLAINHARRCLLNRNDVPIWALFDLREIVENPAYNEFIVMNALATH